MRPESRHQLLYERPLPIGISHIRWDVEYVPQPAAADVATQGAPPEESLRVSAQVEVVQAENTADQPQ